MDVSPPFPALIQSPTYEKKAKKPVDMGSGRTIFDMWRKPYLLHMKKYYTQQEDGSFHPVTFTTELLSEIVADIAKAQLHGAIADKIGAIIESMDLASEAQRAIDGVDMDDIASDAVRDEIESRINSMDIDVSVSL